MSQPGSERLEQLAQSDPAVAPLALLQREALHASAQPGWEQGIPTLGTTALLQGQPLLDGMTLGVDAAEVRRLWQRLAAVALDASDEEGRSILIATGDAAFDGVALIEASLVGDTPRLNGIAEQLGAEVGLLATLSHLAALPLLQACGHKAAPLLAAVTWQAGYCPVCAAWPTLAELRGLERERWLRCGRCGAGWSFPNQMCAFCGNSDHRSLGYLARDNQRDTRRAETCDDCHSYLKTLASLGAFAPAEILVHDLMTVELDVAALEQGYGRPQKPGRQLQTSVQPIAVAIPSPSEVAAPKARERGNGWRPWRR